MSSYKQPQKNRVRYDILKNAVEILTIRRESCAIVPSDYVRKVKGAFSKSKYYESYRSAAQACNESDIDSWETFQKSSIGQKSSDELIVAYLAGPEPSNDLDILLSLGVRAENIWAFESETGAFTSALIDIRQQSLRGVKLMNMSIEDYFIGTPRRFDIIYLDACAPLPSHMQKTGRCLSSIFRHSALAPLGVLITNFSVPDSKNQDTLDDYAHLIAAYLYPKSFMDKFENSEHTITDGAQAHGFVFTKDPTSADEVAPSNDDKFFVDEVRANFSNYYGSFITRHIADIASIIVPTIRLVQSGLSKTLFENSERAVLLGKKLAEFASENEKCENHDDIEDQTLCDEINAPIDYLKQCEVADYLHGLALTEPNSYTVLFTLAWCGLLSDDEIFPLKSQKQKLFFKRWANQLAGKTKGDEFKNVIDAIASFYGWKEDTSLWTQSLQELASYNFELKMPFLCDVPTKELAFYSAFAQLAYPMHCNFDKVRRYSYVAEGKRTRMYTDVIPFDECRYVHDWLSGAHLFKSDWDDLSAQLVFRFALDAIAKSQRWYQDDFLYGCHAIGIEQGSFDAPHMPLREVY